MGDDLGSQRHLVMAGEIFSYYKERMMPLVSRGLRPGMLLNLLRCTGQLQQQSIIWPQMSAAPKVRNPALGAVTPQCPVLPSPWEML